MESIFWRTSAPTTLKSRMSSMKFWCPYSITQIRFFSGNLNRLIGCPKAEVSLAQNLRALLERVLREVPQPVQPFGVGNPALSQFLAAGGSHPFHLYGII